MWLLFVVISKKLTTSSRRSNIVYIWFQRHLRLTGVYVPCVLNTQRTVCQIVVISENQLVIWILTNFQTIHFTL